MSTAALARILLVEDEPAVAQALSLHLRFRGYDVTHALTLRQGLEQLQQGGFALLLTDLGLPDGSGHELVAAAVEREADEDERPECVVMTANATMDNAIQALRAGAVSFLTKPVSTAFLDAVVERALEVRDLRLSLRAEREQKRELVLETLDAMTGSRGLVSLLEALLRASDALLAPGRTVIWLRTGQEDDLAPLLSPTSDQPPTEDELVVAAEALRRGRLVRRELPDGLHLAARVVVEGEPDGAVTLRFAPGERPALDVDQFLGALAGQTANAVQRERLYADLEQSRRQIHSLFEVGVAMTSETSLQRLFDVIVDSAVRICGAERCSLMALDRERHTLHIRASRGIDPETASTVVVPVGTGISGNVAQSGQPLLVANIETDARFGRPNANSYTNAGLVSVPVLVNDTVVGVLNVSNKHGAADFTENDLHLMTLLAGQAAVAIDNAERYHDLNTKAITDGLTGVYLRRYFDECLELAVRTAHTSELPFSLLMADVDHFKAVNDTHGHPAGDAVLQAVAQRIGAQVRDDDLVARYGGEEFAVILARADAATAARVAERIRAALANAPIDTGGVAVPVTISLGVATYGAAGETPTAMLAAADRALFAAKHGGRNQVVIASEA